MILQFGTGRCYTVTGKCSTASFHNLIYAVTADFQILVNLFFDFFAIFAKKVIKKTFVCSRELDFFSRVSYVMRRATS